MGNIIGVNKLSLKRIGLIYGIIIALINYLGFLIISTQQMPVLQNDAYRYWEKFMAEKPVLVTTLSVGSFLIPSVFCIIYIFVCKEDKVAARIINLPLNFSLIGGLGWAFSLLFECVVLIYIRITQGINMHTIAMSSFLNTVQGCIFISALAFMCLNTMHRLYLLPRMFPEGRLLEYNGCHKISTTAIISIFYISTAVFPVFYVISNFRNYSLEMGFEIDSSIYYMIAGMIVLGVVFMFAVASYFSKPLGKLDKATENVKRGLYDQRIEVISNDDFGNLADSFNDMSHSIAEKNKRIAVIQSSIIRGMAMMVESRDNSTGGHINRTSECVRVFIGKMKEDPQFDIKESFAKAIIKAAPMHDLGKIAVDDAILRKPGRFTPEEFEIMKNHSAEGARIVSEVLKESDDEEFKQIAVNVAHYHHEKWDGNGYPTHISGEDIPYEARIMALADVFDALVSKRCYKDSMGYDQAFSIIEESLGTHFDPVLGRFFISCRKDLEELYDNLPE